MPPKKIVVFAAAVLIAGLAHCTFHAKSPENTSTGSTGYTPGGSNTTTGGGTSGTPGSSLFGPVAVSPLPTLSADANVRVTLNEATVLGALGADFIGFSYEKSSLSIPLFTAQNTALIALFNQWGPGILRVGGNTVNETVWNPNGANPNAMNAQGLGYINPSGIDGLAGFLKATHWKVIYGLNSTTGSPALAASEAAYAATALGDFLESFEIGNEPDLYAGKLEPASFAYADFLQLWDSYRTAIVAAVPNATFSGPAAAYNYKKLTVPFAMAQSSNITMLTQHYYRANGKLPTSTIALLLTPDGELPTELAALNTAALSNHIPRGYRLAECNSFYDGGAQGISDGFGAALWLVEYAMTLASHGAQGANFHGGGDSNGYTPIAANPAGVVQQVRADYYGMLFVSLLGPGNLVQTATVGDTNAIYAYAITGAQGSYAMALLNNGTTATQATVEVPPALHTANAILLTAPSLASTEAITLGGSPVKADGSWAPSVVYSVPLQNATFAMDVPAGSAYLIRLQ